MQIRLKHIMRVVMAKIPYSDHDGITDKNTQMISLTIIPLVVTVSWLENAHSRPLFRQPILTRKIGHTEWFLARDRGSLVGLRVRLCMYPLQFVPHG